MPTSDHTMTGSYSEHTGALLRHFPPPHLRGRTVGDWPLHLFDEHQAAVELPTLGAIAAAEIRNLVFQTGGDYRVIPALLNGPSR